MTIRARGNDHTGTAEDSDGPAAGRSGPILAVQSLWAGYGDTQVLRDVSFDVPASTAVALLGPNGAGKTTLLRAISGIITPTKGRVFLSGEEIQRRRPEEITRRGLCHIPEGRGIFPSLTVEENLVLQSIKGQERDAKDQATAAFPQLAPRLRQLAGSLSGGEQQMLALARTYLSRAEIIVVDEASLGLAPLVVDRIFAALTAIVQAGKALLVVEQYIARALELTSTVHILDRGRLVHSGPSRDLRAEDIAERYLGVRHE